MRNSISKTCGGLALGLALAFGAGAAQATITVVADYKLGDADPGAAAGNPGNAITLDSSGNGFNLTKSGSPSYSANVYPGHGGLSMSFDGASSYTGPTVTDATENFGMDAFVKPSDVSGGTIAINGSGCCSGFGLFVFGGAYYFLYGGIVADVIGPAVVDEWAHIAVVNEDGLTSVYFNGVLTPYGFVDPHPASAPVCCSPPLAMTIATDGGSDFNGLIDEVRIFTFASGAFDIKDIPEPATAVLLGFGVAALGCARRKRAA